MTGKRHQPIIAHVDDRADNRYLVQKVLEDAGYEVIQAETGQDGLALIRREKPDLVILDVRLPDISGFDVCRTLKADSETWAIPVLQISAQLTTVDSRVEGLDSGADAYLTAIRPPEIVATVKALLRTKSAEEMALSKAAEWSATFNAVKDPILLLNADGDLLQSNTSGEAFMLTLPASELDNLKREFLRAWDLQRKASEAHGTRDIAIQNKVYRVSIDQLPGTDGQSPRFVIILTDVTTLVEAETAIRRSNETLLVARDAAVAASRAKSAFMSSMSHEFRTPLNAILGYAELMHDTACDSGDETAAKDLARIIASARHLLSLISDVLDIAKIEAGRASLSIGAFDLKSLVDEVVSNLLPLAQNQNTSLVIEAQEELPPVHSDATKVRQILLNLLGNACKFTQNGKITLTMSKEESGDCKLIAIRVTDTGIGISADKLTVIFDAFEQGEHPAGTFTGTGLGLAISWRLAELLGGSLSADSKVNVGSTFTLRLPVEQYQPETADQLT